MSVTTIPAGVKARPDVCQVQVLSLALDARPRLGCRPPGLSRITKPARPSAVGNHPYGLTILSKSLTVSVRTTKHLNNSEAIVRHYLARFIAALALAASLLSINAATAAAEGTQSPRSGPPGCCV